MDDVIFVCEASALEDGGKGVRFPVTAAAEDATGFAVRFHGSVYAYLNRCAHLSIELDWNHGDFFDISGGYLMCSTHGAIYVPETGRCAGGPCRGGRLRPISILEQDGQIFWRPDDYITPARA